MKKKELILFLQFLIIIVSLMTSAEAQSNPDVTIREIMFDPPNSIIDKPQDAFRCVNDSSCQWIEIYNNEDFAVDLSQWKVKTETKTDGIKEYDFGDFILQPKSFLVIATQLEDEDADGFSFARLYGDKDGIWNTNVDGFNAVDSNVPFFATPDLFSGLNTFEHIELKDGSGNTISAIIFFSYYTDPVNVQRNNGYTM